MLPSLFLEIVILKQNKNIWLRDYNIIKYEFKLFLQLLKWQKTTALWQERQVVVWI